MKKLNPSRRKLLKSLGIGGSVGAAGIVTVNKWVTPVVESVVLPAHAQTTGEDAEEISGTFSDEGVATIASTREATPWLANLFVPAAHASSFTMANVCIDVEDNIADVFVGFHEGGSSSITPVFNLDGVSIPFGFMALDGDGRWAINGQFQEEDGDVCVVGSIREDLEHATTNPPDYVEYPYEAKPGSGGCDFTKTE